MAFKTKEIIVHIRKGLVFSIRIIYKSSYDNPHVLGMLFFFLMLYKCLPSLCFLIISCLPVFICTTLLLGTILYYAEEETEEENTNGSQNASTNEVKFDNGDKVSSFSEYDQDSDDDDSIEEEIENQEDEAQEAKYDAIYEPVIKWTEDDEKNLKLIGTSELERNQRLENLIAKRKARKFLSFHYAEKNLIDLDSNIASISVPRRTPLIDLDSNIASISVPRRTPFDIFQFEDGMIPGSAPSNMQPRQNPFNISSDRVEKYSNLGKSNNADIWVAPSTLAMVDEIESGSNGINEISEQDVMQVDDFDLVVDPTDDFDLVANPAYDFDLIANPPTPTVSQFDRDGLGILVMGSEELAPIVEEKSEFLQTENEHGSIDTIEVKEVEIKDEIPKVGLKGVEALSSKGGGFKLGKIKNMTKFKFSAGAFSLGKGK